MGEVEGEKARSAARGEVDGGGVESSIFPIANFALRFFPPEHHSAGATATDASPLSTIAFALRPVPPAAAPGFPLPASHPVSTLFPSDINDLFVPPLSSRRPRLALFFLPSAHDHSRHGLPPFTSPRALAFLSITICFSASTWRGPTDQTSGTADTIKTGKKPAAAHTFRAVSLSLSLSSFFPLLLARTNKG